MPNAATAEIYFIAGMMVLILLVSGFATFFFFRQLKKENAQKAIRKAAKETKETQIPTETAKVD